MADQPNLKMQPAGYPAATSAVGTSIILETPTLFAPNHAAVEAAAAPPGYELLEEVGRGGMGVVYRARDLALNRNVAVKFLQSHYPAGSAAARRFVEEAQITGQLQHPGIPPVHQVGQLPDGRPFLVMKLIKGRTLGDLLKERPNPADDRGRFLAAFEQICQAVGYAHAHQVIHRDIKPANVMVGNFGEVQVMDWGLAKPLTDVESAAAQAIEDLEISTAIGTVRDLATQTGIMLGTPSYMPPEQAGGEIGKIDKRSDVFALGGVLCVILTGKPPYVGEDAESVRLQAIRGQLANAHERLDACGADPELVALARRCLSVEPDRRPTNADEVAAAVAGLRSAAEERARDAQLQRLQATEQRKRARVQLALAATIALLLLAGGGFAWWQDRQAVHRRDQLARNGDAVGTLLDQAVAALEADATELAEIAVGQAETRSREGGADHLAARLAQCRADLAVLRRLYAIDDLLWSDDGYQGTDKALQEWPNVFASYGIIEGSTSPEEAAQRINHSFVKERLLCALDQWLAASGSTSVLAMIKAADPDAFRDQVREALAAREPIRVAQLAAQPVALDQPPRFALILGEHAAVPAKRRKQLLVSATFRGGGLLTFRTLISHLMEPGIASAHIILGNALAKNNEWDQAIAAFKKAIELDPEDAEFHISLADALAQMGDVKGAAAALKEAIKIDPDDVQAHGAFAWLLATGPDEVRDAGNALKHANKTCQLADWKSPESLETLAAAYAAAGDFSKAIEYQKMALALLEFANKNDAAARLELYLQNKPYRDPKMAPKQRELLPRPQEVK